MKYTSTGRAAKARVVNINQAKSAFTREHTPNRIQSVRYIQHPLANPRERTEQPFRNLKMGTISGCDWYENPQLGLIWTSTAAH